MPSGLICWGGEKRRKIDPGIINRMGRKPVLFWVSPARTGERKRKRR